MRTILEALLSVAVLMLITAVVAIKLGWAAPFTHCERWSKEYDVCCCNERGEAYRSERSDLHQKWLADQETARGMKIVQGQIERRHELAVEAAKYRNALMLERAGAPRVSVGIGGSNAEANQTQENVQTARSRAAATGGTATATSTASPSTTVTTTQEVQS